jgi:heme exporter protein A
MHKPFHRQGRRRNAVWFGLRTATDPAITVSSPLSSAGAASLSGGLPVLAASELACRRGERLLFEHLSFELRPGQVVWLRGANGRGKTSLLRLLAGLSTPAAGALTWDGVPLRHAGADFTGRLVYIAHTNALKDDLSALENLQFLARLHGGDDGAVACTEALRRLGLTGRRAAPVRTLSQGQRRRVALARLVLADRHSLWVLDEPFDALDAEGTATLNQLLSAHARGGGAVVLTSHLELSLHDPAPRSLQLDALALQ